MNDRARWRQLTPSAVRVVWLCTAATTAVSLAIVSKHLLWTPGRPRLSSLLQDGWLFAVTVAASILASALGVGAGQPAMRARRVAGAALGLSIAVVLGLAKATGFVVANRYLALGMLRLAVASAASIISTFCLAALLTFVSGVALPVLLPGVARSRRGGRLLCGVPPALAIFAFVGFHLNRLYLPGLLEPMSLLGNAMWAAVCAVASWPLGWLLQRLVVPVRTIATWRPSSVAGISALAAISLGVTALALPAPAPRRPSLILISIDTLRADHLGSYGYGRPTSPSLDRLAADSVRFGNVTAQAPWTLPSHMSMLTGLYPSGHGAVTRFSKMALKVLTLGEILQQEAYQSVAFTDGLYLSAAYGHQGFDRLDDGRHRYRGVRLAEGIVDKAVAFLRRPRRSEPFFLFLHTYQVHCPYDPPREWDRFSDPGYQGLLDTAEMCELDFEAVKSSMKPADFERVIDKYDGEIAYTDDQLGRLFAELKAQGLYETSVIVVTSDHGENFTEHPRHQLGHTTLYDHTVQVPLILKAPGLPRGAVLDVQAESVDILPTVLDLLGVPLPERIDGASLRPAIGGGHQRAFTHSELFPAVNPVRSLARSAQRMIRTDAWKLICSRRDVCELYDLAADPAEQVDLAARRPDVAEDLRREFDRWAAQQERRLEAGGVETLELDDELEAQMRALGYIE